MSVNEKFRVKNGLDATGNAVSNVADPTDPQDAATRAFVEGYALDKSGDSMTGSLSLPKTSGEAILLDNDYGWRDITGDLQPKTGGTGAAQSEVFYSPVVGWTHTASSYGSIVYHMPHDYVPGTDMFIHVHWGHNGTDISGILEVTFNVSYAKRTYPATPFATPIELLLTTESLTMTNSPRYCHRVDEVQLSTPNGSLSQLNTNNLEVDGLILVHYQTTTIPSITGSAVADLPYLFTMDLHYQSTNVGTHSSSPNYYA